jgi:hypothetical protein
MRRVILSLLTIVLLTVSPSAFAQTDTTIRFGLQVAPQQTTVEELKEVWKKPKRWGSILYGRMIISCSSVGPSNESNLESGHSWQRWQRLLLVSKLARW